MYLGLPTRLVASVLDNVSQYHFPPLSSISVRTLTSCSLVADISSAVSRFLSVLLSHRADTHPPSSPSSLIIIPPSLRLVPSLLSAERLGHHLRDSRLASRLSASISTSNFIPPLLDYDSAQLIRASTRTFV